MYQTCFKSEDNLDVFINAFNNACTIEEWVYIVYLININTIPVKYESPYIEIAKQLPNLQSFQERSVIYNEIVEIINRDNPSCESIYKTIELDDKISSLNVLMNWERKFYELSQKVTSTVDKPSILNNQDMIGEDYNPLSDYNLVFLCLLPISMHLSPSCIPNVFIEASPTLYQSKSDMNSWNLSKSLQDKSADWKSMISRDISLHNRIPVVRMIAIRDINDGEILTLNYNSIQSITSSHVNKGRISSYNERMKDFNYRYFLSPHEIHHEIHHDNSREKSNDYHITCCCIKCLYDLKDHQIISDYIDISCVSGIRKRKHLNHLNHDDLLRTRTLDIDLYDMKVIGDDLMCEHHYKESIKTFSYIIDLYKHQLIDNASDTHLDSITSWIGDAFYNLGVAYLSTLQFSQAFNVWCEGFKFMPLHHSLRLQIEKLTSFRHAVVYNYDKYIDIDEFIDSIKDDHRIGHHTKSSLMKIDSPRPSIRQPDANNITTILPEYEQVSELPIYRTKSAVVSNDDCKKIISLVEAYADSVGWTTQRHYAVPTTDIPIQSVKPILDMFNQLLSSQIYNLLYHQFNRQNTQRNDHNRIELFIDKQFYVDSSNNCSYSERRDEISCRDVHENNHCNNDVIRCDISVHDAFIVKYEQPYVDDILYNLSDASIISKLPKNPKTVSNDNNTDILEDITEENKGNISIDNQSKKSKKYQRYLPLHTDESTHSFVIPLNTSEEFFGSGTYFKDLDTVVNAGVFLFFFYYYSVFYLPIVLSLLL